MIDSSGTFIAAYVLVAVIFIGYSLSLWSRARRARRVLASALRPDAGVSDPGARNAGRTDRVTSFSSRAPE